MTSAGLPQEVIVVCKLSFVESLCSCVFMHMWGVGGGGACMDLDYSLCRQDFVLHKYFIVVEWTVFLLLNAYCYYWMHVIMITECTLFLLLNTHYSLLSWLSRCSRREIRRWRSCSWSGFSCRPTSTVWLTVTWTRFLTTPTNYRASDRWDVELAGVVVVDVL